MNVVKYGKKFAELLKLLAAKYREKAAKLIAWALKNRDIVLGLIASGAALPAIAAEIAARVG